jgi:hypothetical protein
LTPSVESIVPLPFWSMPRPPAGRVTGAAPSVRLTVYVPSAPPPCPTTLIAIVAIPARASEDATAHGAPFLESVKPCPKVATGQPAAGVVPAGMNSVNWIWFVACGVGFPVLVPTGGMTLAAVW